MWCRGIRGATTAEHNTKEAILEASKELLQEIVTVNEIDIDSITCIIFTTTPDLNDTFPATAARQLGWSNTALLCTHEIDVQGSMPMCIRVLVLFNTEKQASEIQFVYLRGTEILRQNTL
ncbi:MAG: chorismate mutase [Dehalococcoidia bacterium]|nr:chorismate mutase [Dehalococcoidia bacterium]